MMNVNDRVRMPSGALGIISTISDSRRTSFVITDNTIKKFTTSKLVLVKPKRPPTGGHPNTVAGWVSRWQNPMLVGHNTFADPDAPSWLLTELASLAAEYAGVTVVAEGHNLTVQFEVPTVVLEGVVLGRFRVKAILTIREVKVDVLVSVRALAPNPSKADRYYVHPHINGESLCMGMSRDAIYTAFRELRLCDAAYCITRVLNSYSPSGCYARLSNWNGYPCGNCGEVGAVSPTSCGGCGIDYCTSCEKARCGRCSSTNHKACLSGKCLQCKRTFCNACASSTKSYCRGCVKKCRGCKGETPIKKLVGGLCHPCNKCETCGGPNGPSGICPNCNVELCDTCGVAEDECVCNPW